MGKQKKSDRLPKYRTTARKFIMDAVIDSPEYEKNRKKGLPFFSIKELEKIETKNKDGMTWAEIDKELSKKGMIIKKATFRRYIQDKNLSSAIGYRKTKAGREAVYPKETIRHINFIQYFYRIADNEFLNDVLDALELDRFKKNLRDEIEERLLENGLFNSIIYEIKGIQIGDEDIREIISEILEDNPIFRKNVLSGLNDIIDTFDEKYQKWIKMLEDYEMVMDLEEECL